MKHTIWGKFPLNKDLWVSIDGDCYNTNSCHFYSTYTDAKGYHLLAINESSGHTNKKQRLVAMTFIPNSWYKTEVNHKDCDKDNNTLENFEWVTTAENIQHAIANGAREACAVAGWNKSSSSLVDNIKSLGKQLPRLSNRAIGRQLGIDHATAGKYR